MILIPEKELWRLYTIPGPGEHGYESWPSDLKLHGNERKALGQADKTGWVYLLDRTNGKPLVDMKETSVLQNKRQDTS